MNIQPSTLNAQHRRRQERHHWAFKVEGWLLNVSPRFCKSVTTETFNQAMIHSMKTELTLDRTNAEARHRGRGINGKGMFPIPLPNIPLPFIPLPSLSLRRCVSPALAALLLDCALTSSAWE